MCRSLWQRDIISEQVGHEHCRFKIPRALSTLFRAQELCESRGERSGLSSLTSCGRKATLQQQHPHSCFIGGVTSLWFYVSAVIHRNNNDQLHKDTLCDIVSKQVQDPQASLHTLVSSVEGSSMKRGGGVSGGGGGEVRGGSP